MQPQQSMYGRPARAPRKTSPGLIVAAALGAVVVLCCGVVAMVGLFSGDPEPDAAAGSPPAATARVGADSGLPPVPDEATAAAYLAALSAVDPALAEDQERAIDRGRDQCVSVREHPDDQARLVNLTNQRFTSPDHPDGYGRAKAKRILAAVREHICPTY